jgi:HPt (histidine-containing phosphotransfer) domain-containing protein
VLIADRALVPLQVTTAELAAARARVKKDKHRLVTLLPPQEEKLATAVQLGIWDCIKLYTEKPPKGSANNFGLQALQHWAAQLRKSKGRHSWANLFSPGADMLAGLMSAYSDINHFGKNSPAERDQYAIFLEEAAQLLDKPDLRAAAESFRHSGEAWRRFSLALLPDGIPPFRAVRENMDRQQALFRQQGRDAREAIRTLVADLRELETAVAADFPLDEAAVGNFREELAELLLTIHGIEETAVHQMRAAMSG